jgi:hypothetical protein
MIMKELNLLSVSHLQKKKQMVLQRQVILDRLGLTADEAQLLLG